ncbi:hypothetical protein HPP92_000251 [Vanilla planifolia]|uniref:Protein kinase domain-containing protein n=1 Tax=Vanilla planifolia TaxID=51239 RepID=A0A835RNG8_VANPL|nr:hypothetical protein HPP92_000251 [Vanilla planifolia]
MGFGFLSSLLLLALVVRCFASQQPNTDGFFLSDFLKRMGYELPSSVEYSSSVCSWKGVTCDSKGEKVVSFVASDLGLSGPMPDNTIGKLSKLQFLDLSMNNITGLSTDLWGLGSSLKRLNLSMNRIQGSLPNNIGNFGNMESLDLSHNGFSGEIPSNIGSMLTIRLLNLSRNSFEGTIPDGIADCRNLVSLDLSGNQIRGKMPDFSELESLSHLNLSGNFLNGSILGVLKEGLKVVDLSNNQFQSQVSAGKLDLNFSVSSLVYLDVSVNHLNAEFFSNLSLALSLKHLNLAGNGLSHKKFSNLQLPSRLDYLNLSETSLNGNISPEISKLVGLKALDLSKNHLVGEIPDLSMVVNLQILDLSSNNLTGEIPTPILHRLPNMKWFNLSYNNLSFCKESSLQTFNSSFIGLQNSCPIAANPDVIASTGINHKRLKLAMAIGLSVACLLTGIACFAFAHGRSTSSWAMKQLSYKDEDNVTGPYSFNTDSTMWVADVRGTLLAEGRHGPVYRGFLPGVMHVAIKVLSDKPASNDQDDARELEILGRMRHPNIVPLIGYCLAGDQRIAIYEYMENGNLQNLLHDLPLGIQATEDWSSDTWEDETSGVQKITTSGVSTWRFRHRIALGVAQALAFCTMAASAGSSSRHEVQQSLSRCIFGAKAFLLRLGKGCGK